MGFISFPRLYILRRLILWLGERMATLKGGLSPKERHVLQDDGEADDVFTSNVSFRVAKHRIKAKTQFVLNDAIILLQNAHVVELKDHIIENYGDDLRRLLSLCQDYVYQDVTEICNALIDSTGDLTAE